MKGHTIIIGDIHGCLRELEKMLRHLRLGVRDRVIFLGDLINKGPDSIGVLRRVHTLGTQAECLLGNHEARLLKFRRTGETDHLKNGDRRLIAKMKDKDWTLLERMKTTIALPEFKAIAVHGGFLPKPHWSEQPPEVVTRIQVITNDGEPRMRSEAPPAAPAWADLWKGPEFVVYGHTPRREVFRRPHSIGIDTGCVYGGHLTAMVLPQRQLCQVKALRAYSR